MESSPNIKRRLPATKSSVLSLFSGGESIAVVV